MVLGEGQQAPNPPAKGSGECCEVAQRRPGEASENVVLVHFDVSQLVCRFQLLELRKQLILQSSGGGSTNPSDTPK